MLKITIPAIELYDEIKEEFISSKEQTIYLEHSLVSLSKWESKWKKPFLSKDEKTIEETIDYIKCMTTTQNIDDVVYKAVSDDNIKQVREYIESEMTATTFSNTEKKTINREIVTAEIIYYWMIALNIPFECQKWHLNRLITLITVCNIKNTPPKKMSKREVMNRNSALNAARKQSLHTGG
jgi:isocitrate dehydrogenase kinase/phosphatase